MKKYIISLFCFSALRVLGQTITEYKPVEVSKDSVYLNERMFKRKLNLTDFGGLPKEGIEDVKDIFYNRRKDDLDKIKDHEYIIDKKLTSYIEKTFRYILSTTNLPDKDSFKLHVTRYFIPNAYSTGDWNIYFNIGLLDKLENESQIAFILCHEISHQLLKHTNKDIYSFLLQEYSKAFKNEQKKLAKNKYETADKLVDFMKKRVYNFSAHSRGDEKGADSLGLLLVMKTNFDARDAIRSLQILDSLDADTFTVNYKKYFDGEPFPFKNSWITKGKSLFFGGKAVYEFNEDSISDHPDCPKREGYAAAILKTYNYNAVGKQKNIQSIASLNELIRNCKFEEVEYMFFKKRYAYCLFNALHLSEEFPDDAYPVITAARCLGEMAALEKNHKLYDYVSKPAPNFQENYNELLRLFDRASLTDINQINSNYVNIYLNKFKTNSNFNFTFKKYDLITSKF